MRARLLLLSAVVLWGWTFVATKVLVTELGPIEIFALRLALGLPFLGGILLLRRVRVRFERSIQTHLALLSLACSVICVRSLPQFC